DQPLLRSRSPLAAGPSAPRRSVPRRDDPEGSRRGITSFVAHDNTHLSLSGRRICPGPTGPVSSSRDLTPWGTLVPRGGLPRLTSGGGIPLLLTGRPVGTMQPGQGGTVRPPCL